MTPVLGDLSWEEQGTVASVSRLVNRLLASLACATGTLVVAIPFALIELWSNLWHDPFPSPHPSGQAWAVFHFSAYGALFIAALAGGLAFIAVTVLGCDGGVRSRTVKLALAAGGALLYALLHHSQHVLWYWASGGTW